jgi:hypothetical protein
VEPRLIGGKAKITTKTPRPPRRTNQGLMLFLALERGVPFRYPWVIKTQDFFFTTKTPREALSAVDGLFGVLGDLVVILVF